MDEVDADLNAALAPLSRLAASVGEFEPVWREVEEKQSLCLEGKKRLADDTKSFKKLGDAERLSGIPELLRSYQTEIGELGKRAKFAENALKAALGMLRDAPSANALKDMLSPMLEAKSRSLVELRDQLRQRDALVTKLREAAADVEAELQTVTNQAATVRRLQKQVKDMEAGAEDGVEDARRQRDEEWAKRLDEVRLEHEAKLARQQDAFDRLALQREQREGELEQLRQQRLEEQRWAEQAVLARSMEVESLSNDLEKLQAELERERLERVEHRETQGSVKVLQSLLDGVQQRAAGLEREAAELRKQLAEAGQRSKRSEEDHAVQLQLARDATVARVDEIARLKEQLSLRPSFEEVSELKQQLRNVEAVELSDGSAASTDLERRLLQKQKALEGQLSEARVRTRDQETEAQYLRTQLQAAEDQRNDLQRLVRRLEGDLGTAATGAPPAAGGQTPVASTLLPTLRVDNAAVTDVLGLEAATAAESVGGEAMPSMLDIVSGQRDRFRERVGDLEQERDRWRSAAAQEKKRADTLHGDNVKLLERHRYLQSVQPKQGRHAGGRTGRGRPGDLDLEGSYGSAGTASANPVLALLVSSKPARTFAVVYLSTLHLLVFVVVQWLAHHHTKQS